jgi:hypothetical protein
VGLWPALDGPGGEEENVFCLFPFCRWKVWAVLLCATSNTSLYCISQCLLKCASHRQSANRMIAGDELNNCDLWDTVPVFSWRD